MRTWTWVAVLGWASVAAAEPGDGERLAGQVKIARDSYGMPHIHGVTDAAAVFGAVYARAEDEMARIEAAYGPAIGRTAMKSGPAGLGWDRLVLMYEVPTLAKREYEAAPADVRAITDAAAEALNFYLLKHPEYKAEVIEHWEPWMLFAREYAFALYQVQQEYLHLVAKLGEPAAGEVPQPPSTPDGSNAWAIAGSRTASGKPMLYINPHIPLDEPYEMEILSDEGLHISGAAAYGGQLIPFAGFNDVLGWSLTVNYPDIADTYAIKFDTPDDPLAYKHGDQLLHATKWSERVKVKGANGIEESEQSFAKTENGPLVYASGGKTFTIRVAGIERLRSVEQWYRMAKAKNLDEWKSAVSLFGVVFHNFVYADAAGNIGYIYNAASPRRTPGVDGAGILDGADPKNDWLGIHTLEELPQVWNPACGYVQSSNCPPFVVAAEGENPLPSQFPPGMVGHDLQDGRIVMGRTMLGAAHGWTLDDLERAAFDTKVYSLEPSRAALMKDFEKLTVVVEGEDAEKAKARAELAARVAPAVELIKSWDGVLTLDSTEATLFMIWIEKLFSPAWVRRRAPGDLSAGLAELMSELEKDWGTWRVKWGDINRHQRFDTNAGLLVRDSRESLPMVGGNGSLGVSFCFLAKSTGTKMRYGYHGHSYVGAVEFTDPVRARSIVPFGASRDPASAHFADQMGMYAGGKMKEVKVRFGEGDLGGGRKYRPGE